jgi:predicted CxxxxCH...CXXCH cytochrome family protein
MNANINASPAGGVYDKVAPFAQTAAPVMSTCSNVNCHFEKNTTNRTPAPEWGKTTPAMNCSSCHDTPRGASGSHAVHEAKYTCDKCHPNYGTTNFSHASSAGKHPIVVNTNHNYGGVGVTSISWLPSQSKNYGSCSTYCHSNGKIPSGYTVTTWGTNSTGCNFCHPNLSAKHTSHVNVANLAAATYGSTLDNSAGTTYDFGCGNCHPTSIDSHINQTIDITLNRNHGGLLKSKNNTSDDTTGYVQNIGVSVTCAAAYCHSNGMATPTFYGNTVDWYEGTFTGDKCARCHGNSPNTGGKVGSNAHTAHVVGIHYDDIFNGVSRKLPIGGGNTVNAAHGRDNRSTTINCNICHSATVTSSANDKNFYCSGCHDGATPPGGNKNSGSLITDTSKHVNGTVDVQFISQKIATKAQVTNTAFAAYTSSATGGWIRNKGIYKTYTSGYDVTKGLLSSSPSYTTGAGCTVSCHSNINVKWNDTITCTNCHTRLK